MRRLDSLEYVYIPNPGKQSIASITIYKLENGVRGQEEGVGKKAGKKIKNKLRDMISKEPRPYHLRIKSVYGDVEAIDETIKLLEKKTHFEFEDLEISGNPRLSPRKRFEL